MGPKMCRHEKILLCSIRLDIRCNVLGIVFFHRIPLLPLFYSFCLLVVKFWGARPDSLEKEKERKKNNGLF